MKNSRQHIVPRFYLSEWLEKSPPKGQHRAIWRITRDGSKAYRRSPQKSFVETDRYTVILPNGDRDLRMEHRLDTIEANFSKVLKRIKNGEKLSLLDKAKTATFTAAMLGRSKARGDRWHQSWTDMRKIVETFEAQRSDTTRSSGSSMNMPRPPGAVSISTEDLDTLLLNSHPDLLATSIETAAPILFQMDLSIYSTADEVGFLTSDEPCIMHDPTAYRYHPMTRSAGLRNRNVQVTLPLSPRLMIAFTHQHTYPYVTPIPKHVLDSFNRMMVWHSNEEVVSRSNSTRPEWFAEPGPLPPDAWENRPTQGDLPIFTRIERPETIDIDDSHL